MPRARCKRLLLLTEDLGAGEGILIYPEGTRATAPKIERAKEKVVQSRPELAPLVDPIENLLPPRLGGPLAMLEELPDVDVVFCGHVGFDGFERISDIWSGALVGKTIEVTHLAGARPPRSPRAARSRPAGSTTTGSAWTTGWASGISAPPAE